MSKEPVHDLSTPLLRQRRNLMIISVLMLFVDMAGATVKKFVFTGVTITLDNPDVVFLFMFGFLVYFLYRYYLYHSQEKKSYFKDTFYSKLRELTWLKIKHLKDKTVPESSEYSGEFDFRKMTKDGLWKRDIKITLNYDHVKGKENIGSFKIDIRRYTLEGLRALFYTFFKRSYITDYVLPYVLAFSALWLNYTKVWFILVSQ